MFWIRYSNALGQLTEVSLDPSPTDVEYPEGDALNVRTSRDGSVIIQRPVRDSRSRQWIWRGYGPNSAAFITLWTLLESLKVKSRWAAGLAPTVEVFEDTSGIGGLDRTSGGNRVYTKVKVTQADRQPRKGGGPVIYDAAFQFYIEDPTYSAF